MFDFFRKYDMIAEVYKKLPKRIIKIRKRYIYEQI